MHASKLTGTIKTVNGKKTKVFKNSTEDLLLAPAKAVLVMKNSSPWKEVFVKPEKKVKKW